MTGAERASRERTWATRVYERRKAIGLTQSQVAQLAGITQVALSKIELGRNNPRVTTMDALAKALGTTVEDLFPIGSRPRSRS